VFAKRRLIIVLSKKKDFLREDMERDCQHIDHSAKRSFYRLIKKKSLLTKKFGNSRGNVHSGGNRKGGDFSPCFGIGRGERPVPL